MPGGDNVAAAGAAALALCQVDAEDAVPVPTGIGELDRVLAGGLVPGSVTLIGGEPGIGKSTLVLQALAGLASAGRRTLVVAAEESAAQVARRAERLGCRNDGGYVVAATELPAALEAIGQVRPDIVVVDSIQAMDDPLLASQAGSTAQVRECAGALAAFAKATATSVVLVGHVTKDGSLAGPRTLEHLVDTVLSFEGDRHHCLRLLTSIKHRFGPAGELGLFEMGDAGLVGLEDPSAVLLAGRRHEVAGTVVVPVAEGRRPLLVEIQVLTTGAYGAPRRVIEGLSGQRLALMLAVIERSLGCATGRLDVFVSTVGAVRITEPAADLALGLGIVSAVSGVALPSDLVAFGEVGLGGEIRPAPRAARRLAESARFGFRRAIVPPGTPGAGGGVAPIPAGTLREAVTLAGLPGRFRGLGAQRSGDSDDLGRVPLRA